MLCCFCIKDACSGIYDSCVTIATECGPLNFIGSSATDFRTMSVTGSPKPNLLFL